MSHRKACFVTLTYAPEYLPEPPSVDKRDVQLFLKRLRQFYSDPIRYYACGEYGGRKGRPHYHLILFGIDADHAHLIAKAWRYGRISIDPCNRDTMQYVAGYVTKKYSTDKKEYEEKGLQKEFSLMSLRPAIGSCFLQTIRDAIKYPERKQFLLDNVPTVFVMDGKKWPLGRYLKQKIREILELPEQTIFEKTRYLDEAFEKYIDTDFMLSSADTTFLDFLQKPDTSKRERLILKFQALKNSDRSKVEME